MITTGYIKSRHIQLCKYSMPIDYKIARNRIVTSVSAVSHLGELRSRSQFAKAMWCIDEADWPDGVQALKQLNQKEKTK